MYSDAEIRRLMDVMPASGRMVTKVISKPEQTAVIDAPFPKPWMRERPIWINFDLWSRLSRGERDMVLLRTVCWLTSVKWIRPDLLQGATAIGILGTLVELVQADPIGTVVAGGLTALAMNQIWRNNRSSRMELDADEAAIRVAGRRGYTESEAARYLLSGIETVADIEGRPSLSFIDLMRSQNLRAIAGVSPVTTPEAMRRE